MYKKKLFFLYMFIMFLLGTFFSGCAGPPEEKTTVHQYLKVAIASHPETLDPAFLKTSTEKQLANALFEGLLRLTPEGTIEKAAAEDWEIENEGTKYTFLLRESSWNNGQKVTAYDFVHGWQRILNSQNGSPLAYLFYNIKNAEDYHRSGDLTYGQKVTWEKVGIKAPDEKTLIVELNKADYTFLNKLTHSAFLPVLEGQEDGFKNFDVVCNGPFSLASKQGEKYELIKNEAYWDQGTVKLEGMQWIVGDSDSSVDVKLNLSADEIAAGLKKGIIKTYPLLANYYYQFNTAAQPFKDILVREAVVSAINRNEITGKILQGGQNASEGIIPQGMPDAEPGSDFRKTGENLVPQYSPHKAKELLSQAGFSESEQLKFTLLVTEEEGHCYLANIMADMWEKNLGINVEVICLPWQEVAKKLNSRDYDLVLKGWSADYPDPHSFLEAYVFGKNDTGWRNRTFDEKINTAISSTEKEQRYELYHEAEKILMDGLPVLPLFDYSRSCIVNKRVKGIYFPPVGPAAEFKWTYLE